MVAADFFYFRRLSFRPTHPNPLDTRSSETIEPYEASQDECRECRASQCLGGRTRLSRNHGWLTRECYCAKRGRSIWSYSYITTLGPACTAGLFLFKWSAAAPRSCGAARVGRLIGPLQRALAPAAISPQWRTLK